MSSPPTVPALPGAKQQNLGERMKHWAIMRLVAYVVATGVIVVATGLTARFLVPAAPPLRHHDLLMLTNFSSAIALLVCYALLVGWLERRRAAELDLRKGLPLLLVGSAVGLGLIGAVYFILWCLGLATFAAGTGLDGLLGVLVATFAAASLEELVFRAVLFRIVEEATGTAWAIAVSAIAFGLAHGLNPGTTVLSMAAIALEGGVMFSLAYVASRNLWLPIGIHMSWNFAEGSVFGAQVSGFRASHSMFQSALSGPALLTGGSFGPEASVIAMVMCTVAASAFAIMIVRRGAWQTHRLRFRLA